MRRILPAAALPALLAPHAIAACPSAGVGRAFSVRHEGLLAEPVGVNVRTR